MSEYSEEELANSKRIFKSATPKYTLDWYIKWIASVVVLAAMSLRGVEGFQLWDLGLSIIGIFLWLIVSVLWKDRALILLNGAGLFLLINVKTSLFVLANTLNITNFDVTSSNVQGGPLGDYTTDYISQYVTGVPTSQSNYSIWNGGSGTGPKRFNPIYSPGNEYVVSHPPGFLASSVLINTLDITNFDIENKFAFGGPYGDITTQYWQAPLTTGTPTSQSNFNLYSPFVSGVPPKPFRHPWTNTSTYLASNPIALNNSGQLKDTLEITNFDVEDPSVMGGPLNDISTVYPAANVTHTSPIRGWFAEPSQPPSNFSHSFTPTNTYESFIQAYA